jgi:hypothetical protein
MYVNRRTLLQALGAVPFAAVAPWLEPYVTPRLSRGGMAAPMGSVTNPTGTLGGVSFADLADAMCRADDLSYGFQDLILFSNRTDLLNRILNNQTYQYEKWLTGTIIAMRDDMDFAKDCPPPPLNTQLNQGANQQFSFTDPVTGEPYTCTYGLRSVAAQHDRQCKQKRYDPTGGWITFTRYDDFYQPEPADGYKVEGAYDLTRSGERVTGTFSAPRLLQPTTAAKTCLP